MRPARTGMHGRRVWRRSCGGIHVIYCSCRTYIDATPASGLRSSDARWLRQESTAPCQARSSRKYGVPIGWPGLGLPTPNSDEASLFLSRVARPFGASNQTGRVFALGIRRAPRPLLRALNADRRLRIRPVQRAAIGPTRSRGSLRPNQSSNSPRKPIDSNSDTAISVPSVR